MNPANKGLYRDFIWYWNISHVRNGEAISPGDIKPGPKAITVREGLML